MNDPTRQRRVLDLCDATLEQPAADRDAFLAAQCGEDEALRSSVEALMAAVEASGRFLARPSLPPALTPGTRIGAYRIERRMERGGMGEVWLAQRDTEGFTQQVALKVLRTHLRSADMIARFDEERRILAGLNHPYIARLIDGGTTGDGLPFLVMELVEGQPIDEYCDARKLGINDRLKLVEKVALAIQSAHQNLVVHRDLKPSNILITHDGIPKLLDFGIAYLVGPRARRTHSGETRAFTPEFASPEQIAGDDVTTASDVYSLGVLTYLLLVGKTPFDLDGVPHEELPGAFETLTVPPPSTRVASLRDTREMREVAARRGTRPARLARHLAGDLDAILTKALRRDPAKRYVSAYAFANDLERCGKRLPVAARGDALSYRLGRFVSRYRLSVAAGTAAVVALAAGLAASLWQAHLAERRFEDLRGFAETVIYDVHDEIAELPGATVARQLITREALHYLDRLARDAGRDRELWRDLSMAYKRLGDVLGNPTNANLGDVGGALDSYRKALTIAERLSDGVADDPSIERHKAIVHEKMADVYAWQGDMDSALAHSRQSLTRFQAILQQDPEAPKAGMSVAISHVKRGDLLGHPSFPNAGRPVEALANYNEALTRMAALAGAPDSDYGSRRYLALIHERIGTMQSDAGHYDVARAHFETSLTLREALVAERADQADSRRDVAVAYEKLGDVRLASGEAAAALPFYAKALTIYRELDKADPDNAHAARTLAIGLENLGEAQLAAGDAGAARASFAEALDIRRALVERNPDNERLGRELARVETRVAEL